MSASSGTAKRPDDRFASPTSYGSLQQDRIEINDELLHGNNRGNMTSTYFGRNVRNVDQDKYSFAFLGFVCLETTLVFMYCLWRLGGDLPISEQSRFDTVYTVVILINTIFAWYYAVHGVLKERVVELYVFVAASLLLTTYVIYEYTVFIKGGIRPKGWAAYLPEVRLVLDCLLEPINIFGSLYVARSFGWVSFLTVGADAEFAKMYHTLCLFNGFVKINLQMLLSHLCLGFLSQKSAFRFEWVVELIVLACGLLSVIIAAYMYSREKRIFIVWAGVTLVQPIYILWKVAEFLVIFPDSYKSNVKFPSLVLSAMNMLTFSLMFLWGILAYRNFGKGLSEKIR